MREGEGVSRLIKDEIYQREAEKRDMGEAIHASLEAAVAAEPILAMEEKAESKAGNEAE